MISLKNEKVMTRKNTLSWKYYALFVYICAAMMWNVGCSSELQVALASVTDAQVRLENEDYSDALSSIGVAHRLVGDLLVRNSSSQLSSAKAYLEISENFLTILKERSCWTRFWSGKDHARNALRSAKNKLRIVKAKAVREEFLREERENELLREMAPIEEKAILSASKYGDVDTIRHSLKNPYISVNIKVNLGYTALIWASYYDHLEVVKCLLDDKDRKIKTDVNIKNNGGWTALIYASFWGHLEVVKCLLDDKDREIKTDVNAKDNNGRTALTHAYHENQIPTFKLLALYQSSPIPEDAYPKQAAFIKNVVSPFNLYYKSSVNVRETSAGKVRVIDEYLKFREFCDDKKILADASGATLDRFHALYDRFQQFCMTRLRVMNDEICGCVEGHLKTHDGGISGIIEQYLKDFYVLDSKSISEMYQQFLKYEEEQEEERVIQALIQSISVSNGSIKTPSDDSDSELGGVDLKTE